MSHELSTRYASMVDARLIANLVTQDTGASAVFNTKYEGTAAGGAVKIPVRTAPTARNYDKVTGISLEGGTTTYVTVSDFKDVAINEVIDGYESAAAPDNMVAERLATAGEVGAEVLDKAGIEALETAGTVLATAVLTPETIYGTFVDARTALSQANVPVTGRYALVSPATMAMLLKSPDFLKASDISMELQMAGFVGSIAGFAVKESNHLAETTNFITGHAVNSHRIREWVVEPRIQSLEGSGNHIGASAVQGRWVYTYAVTKGVTVQVHKSA